VLVPDFVGELLRALWLTFKGVATTAVQRTLPSS
jgi:hypothetical protein